MERLLVRDSYSERADREKQFKNINAELGRRALEAQRAERLDVDVFGNPNKEVIASNISPFLTKIEKDLTKGNVLFPGDKNYKTFNNSLILYLSEVFKLDEPPKIYYDKKSNNTAGSYTYPDNIITFYVETGRTEAVTMDDIDTIAHEMWHAHQESVAYENNNGSLSANLYKYNFDNYICSGDDFDAYQNQLVEVEARVFAGLFTKTMESIIGTKRKHRLLGRVGLGKKK